MSDNDAAVNQDAKRMLGFSWILTCVYLLLFYVGTYAVVRVLFTQEHKTLLVGPAYTETVFDTHSSYQSVLYYVYLPLGFCDHQITDQSYVLKKPLLDQIKDKFE